MNQKKLSEDHNCYPCISLHLLEAVL
uniref:Uncharacterized protein n=1 Tax=Rhizophora mucronata TaxID=61149 RepID=A0A2P2Q7E4_RHIMU